MYSTQANVHNAQVHYGSPRPSIEKAIVSLEGPRGRHPAQKRTVGSLVDTYQRHGRKGQ